MSDEVRVSKESNEDRDEPRVMARRFFLRAAIYAAPAISSVVAVQHASAQCSGCNPIDITGSCVPGGTCDSNGCC